MSLAIGTYTDLLTTLPSYAARDDLTTFWPLAVQLFEAKANRVIKSHEMDQRSTASVDMNSTEPEFVSLPSDYQTMRRVRVSSVTGKPRLDFLPNAMLDERRYAALNAVGQPRCFTIIGSELELFPTPDVTYTLEMSYRKAIPALATNSSNWLLTSHPDAYLYGSLLEAEPYMKNDQRLGVWAQGLSTVIDQINALSLEAAYDAGPLVVQVSGVRTP